MMPANGELGGRLKSVGQTVQSVRSAGRRSDIHEQPSARSVRVSLVFCLHSSHMYNKIEIEHEADDLVEREGCTTLSPVSGMFEV